MHAPLIAAHTKTLFSIMMGAGLGAIAWLDLNQKNEEIALVTAALSALMVINGLYIQFARDRRESSYIEFLFIILLASYSLITAHYHNQSSIYWIYFFPLAAFFLFKLKTAVLLVTLYIPIALYIITTETKLIYSHQILYSFLSIALVALFMAIAKEKTNEQLEPLISTDVETGAQQEKRLVPELSIEINRAEREGTGLLLMIIATGSALKQGNQSNYAKELHQCAMIISDNLRPFDSLYRLDNDNFAIVLPHTASTDAAQFAKTMIAQLPLALPIDVGFASLNVADTAATLIQHAEADLAPPPDRADHKEDIHHA